MRSAYLPALPLLLAGCVPHHGGAQKAHTTVFVGVDVRTPNPDPIDAVWMAERMAAKLAERDDVGALALGQLEASTTRPASDGVGFFVRSAVSALEGGGINERTAPQLWASIPGAKGAWYGLVDMSYHAWSDETCVSLIIYSEYRPSGKHDRDIWCVKSGQCAPGQSAESARAAFEMMLSESCPW